MDYYSTYDYSRYASDLSSYSDSTAVTVGLGAFFLAFMGFFLLIGTALAILQIIALWKIFSKAGQAGWKSIIPIYNAVILFKISGLSPWLLLICLAAVIPFIGWIPMLVILIFQANGLSKAFGKSSGFTVGLILLPSIFYLILGLDSSTYIADSVAEENN